MARETVSAVIPTKNVEEWVIPTLEALRFCDEVIVVDMFSTDRTREICESYPNVRFFQRTDFIDANFNYGLEQATGAWILRVDSDEVVSPQLRDSVIDVLDGRMRGFDCYEAFMHLYFFGYRITGGFGNQWRDMLFRRGTARYPLRGEHNGLEKAGPVGRLAGHYDHFTNRSISIWVTKMNQSTDRDVVRDPTTESVPTWRMVWDLFRQFQRMYTFPGRLYRDGVPGLVVAATAAYAVFLQHAKLWEKLQRLQRLASARSPDHR